MPDVFLTGASGYLGGALLDQLLSSGRSVRALARDPRSITPRAGLEILPGDLSDRERLTSQIRGCAAVIHSAALVSAWSLDVQDFYRTNLDGFRNILAASERSGIRTLVYTSTFFALGPHPLPGASEDDGLDDHARHPYQHSKLLARREARRARQEGFPVVILYPGIVYGPGRMTEGNLVAKLITDFLAGRIPGLLGDGTQVWSYSYVEDVARGHILALERAASGGEFVLGGENVSLREFFGALARLLGKKPPRIPIPLVFGMLTGGMQWTLARMLRRAPQMTPSTVRMMYENWACDSARAKRELGYEYRALNVGLSSTLKAMNIPFVS